MTEDQQKNLCCTHMLINRLIFEQKIGRSMCELAKTIGRHSPVGKKIDSFDWDSLWVDEVWISFLREVQNLETSFSRRLDILEDLKTLLELFPEAEKFIDQNKVEKELNQIKGYLKPI
jgi:hypothetical protein